MIGCCPLGPFTGLTEAIASPLSSRSWRLAVRTASPLISATLPLIFFPSFLYEFNNLGKLMNSVHNGLLHLHNQFPRLLAIVNARLSLFSELAVFPPKC